ncbi:Peptidase A1 [Macleaya cordata]|uniref:Peptidase A1 n=1 Tax=Macleaya cordata TaxID=56857 RepID=A0A200QX51_MACCD|nr:Peptidase A1 [Macleaya cordata]
MAEKKPITGLTLKLIHRDSIEPGNLTDIEKLHKLIDRSKLRALHLFSTVTNQPDGFNHHPLLKYESGNYVVQIGVGTPPPSDKYYLILDTGSDLVWLQCGGCDECFPQTQPMYNPHDSSTYQMIPCNHPLCDPYPCDDGHCNYEQAYSKDVYARGILSKDGFVFVDDVNHNVTFLDGVIFGCGYQNHGFEFAANPNNNIVGVFGLGPGHRSFTSQFDFQRRFSYCLADWQFGPPQKTSKLVFGDDALLPISGRVQTTPIVATSARFYYLKLKDMTVGEKRIGFAPGTFDRKPDNSGGFIIDSGTSISFFVKSVYDVVRQAILDYMKPYNLSIIDGSKYKLDLCFKRPEGFGKFPSILLHFQGSEYPEQEAELTIDPFGVFFIGDKDPYFCLGILPTPGPNQINILGAKQQVNNRFLFDGTNNTLSFIPEVCELS